MQQERNEEVDVDKTDLENIVSDPIDFSWIASPRPHWAPITMKEGLLWPNP